MRRIDDFLSVVHGEFPDDRLTFQNRVPTFHPASAVEASALVKLANEHRSALYINGFGNNIVPAGAEFEGMLTVKTDRLNTLIDISAKDLYVTAGAGYPLREINSHLAEHKLMLVHSMLPYVGSVGGAVAVGLSAEHHGHDLPLKRYLLQAEIVTPQGEIITPGSICFKSVSGYDVVRVYAGSWGLLGLIISATFRVMPDSAADEFVGLKQRGVDRAGLIAGLDEANTDPDAVYSRKIKDKFDPNGIFPII